MNKREIINCGLPDRPELHIFLEFLLCRSVSWLSARGLYSKLPEGHEALLIPDRDKHRTVCQERECWWNVKCSRLRLEEQPSRETIFCNELVMKEKPQNAFEIAKVLRASSKKYCKDNKLDTTCVLMFIEMGNHSIPLQIRDVHFSEGVGLVTNGTNIPVNFKLLGYKEEQNTCT